MTDLVVTAEAGWLGGELLRRPIAVALDGARVGWVGDPRRAPVAPRRHVEGVLLPGLVDHHVHSGLIDVPALLRSGLTTVHDLGWIAEEIWPKSRASDGAAFDGPRILAAGPFLTAPGGYPTDRSWAPDGMAWEIEGERGAVEAVRALAVHQPVTVKVALHADAGAVFDDATLAAVVDTSHDLGLEVTAHAEGAGQVERAIHAGVDQLAHTPAEPLDDAALDALAKSMRIVSTVDIYGWGEPTAQRDTAVRNLRRFHQRGGRIRYGTDLGNGPLPEGVNSREIAALTEVGMSPSEILRAMTTEHIDVGARADLVTVPADPLSDPLRLAEATTVLKAGVALNTGGRRNQNHRVKPI